MNRNAVNRRDFLRHGGLAVVAGATLPLLGSSTSDVPGDPDQQFAAGRFTEADRGYAHELRHDPANAHAAGQRGSSTSDVPGDPDQQFAAGRFTEADRGYAHLLRHDPANAHFLAQRGYIALLSNRFADAERFLTQALDLAPMDTFTRHNLANCFVRQDQLARAAPLLRQTGSAADAAAARQYAAITGSPYQIRGAKATRVPLVKIDPLPMIKASVNGSRPQHFVIDTGAGSVGLSHVLGSQLGLRPAAAFTTSTPGQSFTLFLGVLESFRVGEIELRNIPVQWSNAERPGPPNGPEPIGAIGSVLFYHFLTTLDYAGRGLVLRRKSEAGLRRFQAAARRARATPLPLWLAGTHFPCTLGSLNNYGPRVVSLDTGGNGIGIAASTQGPEPWSPSPISQAGITVDYHNLTEFGGKLFPSISPDKISLGDAVGARIPGIAMSQLPGTGPDEWRFHTIANFTHEFFKPFAVTFDFTDMNLYVTPTVPDQADCKVV